jgi:hypothetical protein
MTIHSFQDAAADVQKTYNRSVKASDRREVEQLALELGTRVWPDCPTAEHLRPVLNKLSDRKLKVAFLKGLRSTIDRHQNHNTSEAANLRPHIDRALRDTRSSKL